MCLSPRVDLRDSRGTAYVLQAGRLRNRARGAPLQARAAGVSWRRVRASFFSSPPGLDLDFDRRNLMATAPETLAPGAIIAGKYRVIRELGQGGFGAVYEIAHLRIPG